MSEQVQAIIKKPSSGSVKELIDAINACEEHEREQFTQWLLGPKKLRQRKVSVFRDLYPNLCQLVGEATPGQFALAESTRRKVLMAEPHYKYTTEREILSRVDDVEFWLKCLEAWAYEKGHKVVYAHRYLRSRGRSVVYRQM